MPINKQPSLYDLHNRRSNESPEHRARKRLLRSLRGEEAEARSESLNLGRETPLENVRKEARGSVKTPALDAIRDPAKRRDLVNLDQTTWDTIVPMARTEIETLEKTNELPKTREGLGKFLVADPLAVDKETRRQLQGRIFNGVAINDMVDATLNWANDVTADFMWGFAPHQLLTKNSEWADYMSDRKVVAIHLDKRTGKQIKEVMDFKDAANPNNNEEVQLAVARGQAEARRRMVLALQHDPLKKQFLISRFGNAKIEALMAEEGLVTDYGPIRVARARYEYDTTNQTIDFQALAKRKGFGEGWEGVLEMFRQGGTNSLFGEAMAEKWFASLVGLETDFVGDDPSFLELAREVARNGGMPKGVASYWYASYLTSHAFSMLSGAVGFPLSFFSETYRAFDSDSNAPQDQFSSLDSWELAGGAVGSVKSFIGRRVRSAAKKQEKRIRRIADKGGQSFHLRNRQEERALALDISNYLQTKSQGAIPKKTADIYALLIIDSKRVGTGFWDDAAATPKRFRREKKAVVEVLQEPLALNTASPLGIDSLVRESVKNVENNIQTRSAIRASEAKLEALNNLEKFLKENKLKHLKVRDLRAAMRLAGSGQVLDNVDSLRAFDLAAYIRMSETMLHKFSDNAALQSYPVNGSPVERWIEQAGHLTNGQKAFLARRMGLEHLLTPDRTRILPGINKNAFQSELFRVLDAKKSPFVDEHGFVKTTEMFSVPRNADLSVNHDALANAVGIRFSSDGLIEEFATLSSYVDAASRVLTRKGIAKLLRTPEVSEARKLAQERAEVAKFLENTPLIGGDDLVNLQASKNLATRSLAEGQKKLDKVTENLLGRPAELLPNAPASVLKNIEERLEKVIAGNPRYQSEAALTLLDGMFNKDGLSSFSAFWTRNSALMSQAKTGQKVDFVDPDVIELYTDLKFGQYMYGGDPAYNKIGRQLWVGDTFAESKRLFKEELTKIMNFMGKSDPKIPRWRAFANNPATFIMEILGDSVSLLFKRSVLKARAKLLLTDSMNESERRIGKKLWNEAVVNSDIIGAIVAANAAVQERGTERFHKDLFDELSSRQLETSLLGAFMTYMHQISLGEPDGDN